MGEKSEPLTPLEYLNVAKEASAKLDEEQWKQVDRALWAAFELLGMNGRISSKAQHDRVREVAIEVLEMFPEGLPELRPEA